jgi:hypothetical protein
MYPTSPSGSRTFRKPFTESSETDTLVFSGKVWMTGEDLSGVACTSASNTLTVAGAALTAEGARRSRKPSNEEVNLRTVMGRPSFPDLTQAPASAVAAPAEPTAHEV